MSPTRTRLRPAAAVATILLTAAACGREPQETPPPMAKIDYPPTERGAQVDDYHGTQVADPYRWLEEIDGDPVRTWVAAQNEVSGPFLERLPARAAIESRLTELWSYERRSVPFRRGDRYFWFHNDGLQDHDVMMVADRVDGEGRVLIDPNTWSADGKDAFAGFEVSHDGDRVAYARSAGGTDWRDWRVREVATGEDLPDLITFTKFSDVAWTRDGSGFYYSRHPAGADGRGDGHSAVTIHFHRLGTEQSADREVFTVSDHPRRNPYGRVTDDGRWLVIDISEGYFENAIWLLDLTDPRARPRPLLDDWDARYRFVHSHGSVFYFRTTNGAPRGRLIAVDASAAAPRPIQQVIPETEDVLEQVTPVGGHFVASYLVQATSLVEIWHPNGRKVGTVELPPLGTASGFPENWSGDETFFAFESYVQPRTIYRLSVPSGETREIHRPAFDADLSRYRAERLIYHSEDGTGVLLFLVHRADMERDGANPTILYGYGGFNLTLTPSFSVSRLTWLEMGGVYAVAGLRGGGEGGEAWHRAGARLEKQNVFDDFIAAAEFLIEQGYTRPEKLAVEGGSNGGLLVGAVLTQRPELFGAALPDVGVLDMLRYHLPSLNARHWADDYGLSENEDDFRAQLAYSPLHNLTEGVCYPPTLVTTGDRDDRVVPWHSYKFAAALQHAQSCDRPVLLRVETRVGHGAGTPTAVLIEKVADRWAFASWALGLDAGAELASP